MQQVSTKAYSNLLSSDIMYLDCCYWFFCQVNNAGCMVHEKRIDNLGFETNFATNALAVHILTERLIPLLRKSSDPRVVCLSNFNLISL